MYIANVQASILRVDKTAQILLFCYAQAENLWILQKYVDLRLKMLEISVSEKRKIHVQEQATIGASLAPMVPVALSAAAPYECKILCNPPDEKGKVYKRFQDGKKVPSAYTNPPLLAIKNKAYPRGPHTVSQAVRISVYDLYQTTTEEQFWVLIGSKTVRELSHEMLGVTAYRRILHAMRMEENSGWVVDKCIKYNFV